MSNTNYSYVFVNDGGVPIFASRTKMQAYYWLINRTLTWPLRLYRLKLASRVEVCQVCFRADPTAKMHFITRQPREDNNCE